MHAKENCVLKYNIHIQLFIRIRLLPYKQGVTGSNPVLPTERKTGHGSDRFLFSAPSKACFCKESESSRKQVINSPAVLSHHRTCRSAYGGSLNLNYNTQ